MKSQDSNVNYGGLVSGCTLRPPCRRATAPAAIALRAVPAAAAEEFADVVGAAVAAAEGTVDLRVKRGAGDAQLKSIRGRVVALKGGAHVLQLTYKRRGACDLQSNHGAAGGEQQGGRRRGRAPAPD